MRAGFDQYIIILNRKSKFSLLVNDLSLEFSPLSFSPSNESRKFEDLGTKGLILNDQKFEL